MGLEHPRSGPSTPASTARWLLPCAALLFCAALVGALLQRFGWFFMASDDAYIYLGYAKSFVTRGELFSYNPGEHSAGTTGLLYFYVLAGAAALTRLLFWPDAASALTLCAFAVNGALFVVFGSFVARAWARLSDAPDRSLACSSRRYSSSPSWPTPRSSGAGSRASRTRSPLRSVCGSSNDSWPGARFGILALLAAALGCTRPELLPFGALLTALAARGASPVRALGAAALFAACTGALTLPSR